MEPMQLNEYPTAIADLERQLLEVDQRILNRKEQLAFCLSVIDRAVAFNAELKNDTQRKAERSRLMETDPDYIKANLELRKSEAIRGEMEIDLNLLTRTFSLLKLERREAIARMELSSSMVA